MGHYNLGEGWRRIRSHISKSVAVLLCSGLLVTSALGTVSAQTITIKEKDATLHQVLEKIRRQANVDLVGNMTLLKNARPVNLDVENEELKEVLKEISKGQPVDLGLESNAIIVKKKEEPARSDVSQQLTKAQVSAQRQDYSLVGTITDEHGAPLEGVTVKLLNSENWASTTSEDGSYSVMVYKQSEVMYSMVGYETQIIKVSGRNHINVVLKRKDHEIDETVVTGYANVKRESFTGAAKTITRQELEKFNSNNIFSVLQALDPSFKVDENVQAGSNPNVIPEINIRGVASVGEYAVNAPLVILDGFEVSLTTLYDLDVNRIESISILKDASSTSLYGSRGSNGVITIETRLPKDGKFTITYDAKPSITWVDLSDYNLMNAEEKLRYEKLAGIYDVNAFPGDEWDHMEQEFYDNLYASRLNNVLSGVDTYWLKQPVRSSASVNHSLRMEGGSNDVRYSLEGNYNDFKGVMKESGRIRGGAGFNLIYRIKDKITFNNKASYQYTKEYNSPYGSFEQYVHVNPYERMYDDNGNYTIRFAELGQWYEFGPVAYNPLYNTTLGFRDDNKSHLISNNMMLDWFVNSEFRVRARGVISRMISNGDKYTSPFHSSFFNTEDQSEKGSYVIANGNETQVNANLTLEYSKNILKHQIVSSVVGEIRSEDTKSTVYEVTGFNDDRFISPSVALQYALNTLPETVSIPKRAVGLLGSVFYSYDNRYVLSGSLRSDGSSLFGKENRYGTFWSTGVAYNVHNEKWFENQIVNRFRLRANVGTNGSENFNGDMLNTGYRFIAGNYYYKQYAAKYINQGNSTVRWPVVKQVSLGTEIALLQDLVALDFSVYDKVTSNMISNITVAPSFGFYDNMYVQNLGKVSNKGFELNANVRVLQNYEKEMSWYVTVGAARNKSKLKEISNELRSMNESLITKDDDGNIIKPSTYYEEGQSLSIIRGVPSLGIDPASGRELFLTRDGNVSYQWDANDQKVIGDEEVKLFGNITSTFNYKRLSVQVLANYSLGGDVYNQTLMDKIENNSPYANADKRVLQERWKQPGDNANYKSISDHSTTQVSSRFVQKENFLRLSSININYDIPHAIISKYNLQRLRVNFSTNDVFRYSTVRMERGIEYPYARTYNFGVMVQF